MDDIRALIGKAYELRYRAESLSCDGKLDWSIVCTIDNIHRALMREYRKRKLAAK